MAVTAGIRPEHFEWAEAGQAAAIEAPAAVVEPLGSDTLVGIALGEHRRPGAPAAAAGAAGRESWYASTWRGSKFTCLTGQGRRIAS